MTSTQTDWPSFAAWQLNHGIMPWYLVQAIDAVCSAVRTMVDIFIAFGNAAADAILTFNKINEELIANGRS